METIGKYLKETREAKGLSLEDVSDITKIKVAFLEYIEKDDFSPIGGFGYAKVMLATYAKAVHADIEKVMLMFDKHYDSDDFEMKPLYMRPRKHKKLLLPGSIFSFAALFLLLIVLAIVVYNLYNKGLLDFSLSRELNGEVVAEAVKQDSVKSVNVVEQEKPEEEEAEPTEAEEVSQTPAETESVAFDEQALRDSTDYVDNILFDNKDSAFNYKE